MSFKEFAKSNAFVAILMSVVAIVYVTQISNVFDRKFDLNGDNILYYTLAQSLSSGNGYSLIFGLDEPTPHMHFPPGYPAFISVLMRLGIDTVLQIKIVNCILLLAAILLLFLIMRKIGCKPIFSAIVCILISCHAEVLRWASMMMSEQLFLVVNMLIVYLICGLDLENIFKKSAWKSWIRILIIGLLAGYSYLIRTMGTSMTVAVLAWCAVMALKVLIMKSGKRNWRKAAGYGVLALVVLFSFIGMRGAWNARNQRISPGFKSDYVGDFNKKPGGQTMDSLSDWVERAGSNFKSYITYYIPDSVFEKKAEIGDNEAGVMAWAGGFVLFLLIVLGMFTVSDAGLLILFYCGVTFAVLLVWPEQYSGLRYFITLIPLLIFGFCRGLYVTVGFVSKKIKGREIEFLSLASIVVLLFIIIPRYEEAQGYYHNVAKIKKWKDTGNAGIQQYALASEWMGKNLPEDARVICRKPELFYMLSGYRHANGFPQYATPEEIMEMIDRDNVEYIILDVMYIHAYRTVYPAIQKYPDRFRFIKSWSDDQGSIPTLLVQVLR